MKSSLFIYCLLAFLLFPVPCFGMDADFVTKWELVQKPVIAPKPALEENPAIAKEPDGIDDLLVRACELWDVPLKLARAIARQESGMNPWAVNVAGDSFMFKSKVDAIQKIDWAWDNGFSFDVGLMQVNSQWIRKFRLDPHMVLEPRNNIILGTWILSREIERFGISWKAVASYHTPLETNYDRGLGYAASVISLLRKEQ